MIAANTTAKRAGVTTGMAIADARRRCSGIALVPQQTDLYKHGMMQELLTGRTRLTLYRLRVLGQWFDGIRFYAAASSPRRSRRTWAGLR